jgi:hypothetical protein
MDPVEVVWGYEGVEDQAIAGLWAALFAWGQRRVAIQKTRALLQALVPSPYAYLQSGRPLHTLLRHRTWKPETIALVWEGLREIYGRYGGLEAFFRPYREGLWEGVAAFQAGDGPRRTGAAAICGGPLAGQCFQAALAMATLDDPKRRD